MNELDLSSLNNKTNYIVAGIKYRFTNDLYVKVYPISNKYECISEIANTLSKVSRNIYVDAEVDNNDIILYIVSDIHYTSNVKYNNIDFRKILQYDLAIECIRIFIHNYSYWLKINVNPLDLNKDIEQLKTELDTLTGIKFEMYKSYELSRYILWYYDESR